MVVVHFSFQYAPEAFHRGIVQALAWTRHTLANLLLFHPFTESMAGVLCASVTMNQRSIIIALQKRLLKGVQNQSGIILSADRKRDNVPAI